MELIQTILAAAVIVLGACTVVLIYVFIGELWERFMGGK